MASAWGQSFGGAWGNAWGQRSAGGTRHGVEFVSIPTWRTRLRKQHAETHRPHIPRSVRRKAKALEIKAAELALTPDAPDWKIEALAQRWAVLVHAPQATAEQLFMARVRIQMQRMEDDDEEALLLA